jgi:sugar lactone lactonase YvrE
MQIDVVLDVGATIGELPTWSEKDGVLYWMDVKAPALYRFDPQSKAQRSWTLPADIGAFALTTDEKSAVVALRSGLFMLDLSSEQLHPLADPPFDPNLHRFNEGACDSHGRFWIGTMFEPVVPGDHAPQPGHLFCYTSAQGLQRTEESSELHNGMGWNLDESLFYLTHSNTGTVHAFPFDVASGTLGKRRLFAVIEKEAGIPDGSAVDAEGGYWCALHGGGRLRRYRPDGTLDREVRLPVSQPTMCAFGGAALDILYVTSAAQGLDAQQRRAEPHAGAVLALRPGVAGIPRQNRFRP